MKKTAAPHDATVETLVEEVVAWGAQQAEKPAFVGVAERLAVQQLAVYRAQIQELKRQLAAASTAQPGVRWRKAQAETDLHKLQAAICDLAAQVQPYLRSEYTRAFEDEQDRAQTGFLIPERLITTLKRLGAQ